MKLSTFVNEMLGEEVSIYICELQYYYHKYHLKYPISRLLLPHS